MLIQSKLKFLFFFLSFLLFACEKEEIIDPEEDILGFNLLSELTGHWVGTNETAYGFYDWFSFDFRPISSSHLHSIYEGGTNQNIITSVFVADYNDKQQLLIRNGGWLGNQYRASYFILDKAENNSGTKYFRFVDAIGGEKRSYIEFRFTNDSLFFDAYKDNSGTLDDPIKHMGFKGVNYNPSFSVPAIELFNYPQKESEIDLNNKFVNLIDPDSALFLEESDDPFPKSQHRHLSELKININRISSILDDKLLLYISKEQIVNEDGEVDFENLNTKVVRTIDVASNEAFYLSSYLHPDDYYITAFADLDNNFYPSTGDISNVSKEIEISAENFITMDIDVNKLIQ